MSATLFCPSLSLQSLLSVTYQTHPDYSHYDILCNTFRCAYLYEAATKLYVLLFAISQGSFMKLPYPIERLKTPLELAKQDLSCSCGNGGWCLPSLCSVSSAARVFGEIDTVSRSKPKLFYTIRIPPCYLSSNLTLYFTARLCRLMLRPGKTRDYNTTYRNLRCCRGHATTQMYVFAKAGCSL